MAILNTTFDTLQQRTALQIVIAVCAALLVSHDTLSSAEYSTIKTF